MYDVMYRSGIFGNPSIVIHFNIGDYVYSHFSTLCCHSLDSIISSDLSLSEIIVTSIVQKLDSSDTESVLVHNEEED
jgi:hypothetical protein